MQDGADSQDHGSHMETLPFVSVIVPVRNEERRLDRLALALAAQTYPSDRCEYLVIDNDSTDRTPDIIASYSHLTGLSERRIRNAEAARNTGMRVARGEIIAFTDGDCCPDPRWLELAVKHLLDKELDLVAGAIEFTFNSGRTPANLYDAVTNLQHEQSVRDRGIAFTANLLVKRAVLDATGRFPEDRLGGGDFWLTSTATSMGFRLGYCRRAVVQHPARGFSELLKKAYRIGKEKGASSRGERRTPGTKKIVRPHFRHLIPPALAASLQSKKLKSSFASFWLAYTCGILYVAAGSFGLFKGYVTTRATRVS